jgi:hypothetical protein
MKPPRNLKKYLDGKLPLPAGFVPLAQDGECIIGINPQSDWYEYYPKEKDFAVVLAQTACHRIIMSIIVAALGGTSAKAAAAIGVSPRTVESWRCGRKRLTVERAYEIAQAMANA